MHEEPLRPEGPPRARPPRPPGPLVGIVPETPSPAWKVCLLTSVVASALVRLGVSGLEHYGYMLFMGVPLIIGFVTAHLYQKGRDPILWRTVGVVVLTAFLVWLFLMVPPLEGLVCMAMAAGLALPFIILGVLIAMWIRKRNERAARQGIAGNLHSFVILLVPAGMLAESRVALPPPLLEQTTSIEINATPEQVWRYIPAFPRIESTPTKLLGMGIAYPLESTITGEGIGAKRQCVLSTGTMPEVITAWEPGRRLEFDVLATPTAMEETSPFGKVQAAHDNGYFICKHGRFVLTPLPGGRTRVEGTSWFQHDLWPQFYWAPLTKEVVHEVHERVLQHVKALAEKEGH